MLASIKKNDELSVIQNLQQYKVNGQVVPEKVLMIPSDGRIPMLAKNFGVEKVHAAIVARLTLFVNSYNVVRPMTPIQIVHTAAAIIDSANEDDLAIEDLLLFFDGAMKSQYGRVLDHLDQHVIFEMFENYRQARHLAFLNLRDQVNASRKQEGERSSDLGKGGIAATYFKLYGEPPRETFSGTV